MTDTLESSTDLYTITLPEPEIEELVDMTETESAIARFMNERGMTLEECFKYLDIDQDGLISSEELNQGLIAMSITFDEQNLSLLVSVFDNNDD